jgi:hypothetical protein
MALDSSALLSRKRRKAAVCCALWTAVAYSFFSAASYANDSTAELVTGGLTFSRSADIEMRSEDLFISTQQIRVTYRFLNHSNKDITELVAFPMPDVTVSNPDQSIAVPTDDPENILGFATKVDGVPVVAKLEQKVLSRGVDYTALLRQLGVPLEPYLDVTNKALDDLPHDKWPELIKLGLAETLDEDVGQGMKTHLEARWTLKTTYYWRQTFPAGTELSIEHTYKPSVGSSAVALLALPDAAKDPSYREYVTKYCIDRDFLASVNAAKSHDDVLPTEQRISYILITGANWAGPIREFRLVIDKGAPNALVSFCALGVRKIGPTQFEIRHSNFTPQSNLDILLLTKRANN